MKSGRGNGKEFVKVALNASLSSRVQRYVAKEIDSAIFQKQ